MVAMLFASGMAFIARDDAQTANASPTRENPAIAAFREQCFDLGGRMIDESLPNGRSGLMCWDGGTVKLLKKTKVKAEVAK